MRIVQCDRSHREQWNAFVDASPLGSFYHRFEWRDINADCFGHESAYLAAFDGDRVVGIFPIVGVKSQLFGTIACSLPFVNYGGVCAESAAVETLLIDEAKRVTEKWNADYLEIRSLRNLGDFPTSQHKVSFTVSLDPDPEVLWNGFTTGHRKEIRRGYKHGLSTTFGGAELVGAFYELLSESWRDLGTPIYARSFFDRLVSTFGSRVKITVVYAGNEPAAAAFCGFHGDMVEGMWLASRARYRRMFIGYVLYWELIKDACQQGYRHFHLGRTSADSGGETFKKKWRAEPQQLYWQYVLRTRRDIPQLNVTNPRYRLAIKAWQKLPVPITQMVGPLIARSIP